MASMATFFADHFKIDPDLLDEHGAFNISLVTDLPVFIDPFLLFNSTKPEYQELHQRIIQYLVFLRDKSLAGPVHDALLRSWYCFPEIRQTWLGFSRVGNSGSGLGFDFAAALHENLYRIFSDFGTEQVTRGSHLEKVCLIREGVGRDNISDFTANLIKEYLCNYSQTFALAHLAPDRRRRVAINNVRFNFATERWEPDRYVFPWINGDYVILTPKDMLTKDDTWINKNDLIREFHELPNAIPDDQLRMQVSNYFQRVLPRHRNREANQRERADAARLTILQFPPLIDYYIRLKEDRGDQAENISHDKIFQTEQLFILRLQELQAQLKQQTPFYETGRTTYEEAHARLAYLKDVIENKGGHRFFYHGNQPIRREEDLHVLYRLVWIGTPSDVSAEVNDGRGPADYKVSRGSGDKTIVEMKLAKNTHLRRNLEKQAEIYQKASDAKSAIKAIIYFTEEEQDRVELILKELKLLDHPDMVLIDARKDNKPSGSKA
jgi:hypothetical protein